MIDDKWIYSQTGQTILRAMNDLAKKSNFDKGKEPVWSNDFAIAFAKGAYELGLKQGQREGYEERSWEDYPDSTY